MNLDELIGRAKALPGHHRLREALLLDLYVLLETQSYTESTVGVPGCVSALLGLGLNHLEARLIACEERLGEHQGDPR